MAAMSTLKNDVFTLVVVVILLLVGGYYFYGKNFQKFLATNGKNTAKQTILANAKTEHIIVTGADFSFTPNQITVTKGDKIQITFKNSEGLHNLTIPDFHAKTKTIEAGKEDTLEFFADKTGTFPFYCSYAHHKEFGMTGKLIVK
jgi:plastocyanin